RTGACCRPGVDLEDGLAPWLNPAHRLCQVVLTGGRLITLVDLAWGCREARSVRKLPLTAAPLPHGEGSDTQYALAKTTRAALGLPVTIHLPGSALRESGIQRTVAFVSAAMRSSVSRVPS